MKLLSIKYENSIIVYSLNYKNEDIEKLINFIHGRYSNPAKIKIKTSFLDNVPISFGKLDNKSYKINKYNILYMNKDENLENDTDLLYFPQTSYGEMEVNYEHYTNLEQILRETFLTNDDKVLIDMTDLIKYRNTLFEINNTFKFDKTIDLNNKNNKSKTNWIDKIDTFVSLNSYDNHINNILYNLNEPLTFENSLEFKKITKSLQAIINILQTSFNVEEIAMFPTNLIKKDEYRIIERFGIRNEDCNYSVKDSNFYGWFGDKLNDAKINYDGAQIIENFKKPIIKNYDLDGVDYNLNALRSIKNNQYIKELK